MPDRPLGLIAADAIRSLAPAVTGVPARRRALVLASFLGDRARSLRARSRGLVLPAFPRADDVLALVPEVPVGGARLFVHGMPGASVPALAIASDLLSAGEADQVVVCAVDLVDAELDDALTTVRCEDRPFFRSAVAAVLLEPPCAGRRALRRLGPIGLFTPLARRHVPLDLDDLDVTPFRLPAPPSRIVTSGCLDFDLRNASTMAERVWPGWNSPLTERRRARHLGADALLAVLAGLDEPDLTIVAANALGGSGVIHSRPASSTPDGTAPGGRQETVYPS